MVKLLSLFSGIGSFEKAMMNQDIPFNLVGYSEIDKYASKSYSAIYGVDESMNLGDITKIDEKAPPPVDFITYGFPCQDISLAGKQKGLFNEDGTQTRSGLFFDALRIIEATQPKVAIAENVKNLVSKKFKEQFEIVLDSLEQAGYNNYWKILNSKDFGIPQNRERVFIVSIRKDCDTGVFEFPEPYELKLRLKDMLEDEVDEKFYLSEKMNERLINVPDQKHGPTFLTDSTDVSKTITTRTGGWGNFEQYVTEPTGCQVKNKGKEFVKTIDIAGTLLARDYKGLPNTPANAVIEPVRLGNIYGEQHGTGHAGNVWDKNAISLALMTMQGGNRQPMVVVRTNNKKGYDEAVEGDYINIERPESTTRRGRVGHGVSQTLDTKENHCVVTSVAMRGRYNESGQVEQNIEVSNREVANAITTVQKDSMVHSNLRIRKLTPKECFRLMGFDDESFHKAEAVNSNTQLYKQAGNSIVVDVAEELLCMMFDEDGELYI